MDPHRYTCIKLLTFALPLFCLLSRNRPAASYIAPPPPTSALLAADALRARGYSIFASLLESTPAIANLSGTLLAPPDFVFSSAAAKFLSNTRPTPRPSITLLLYHTIRPPLVLTWPALASRADGEELRTFYRTNCIYLSRNPYGGEVSISLTPYRNPMAAVKVRQPDLYVDDKLAVHGVDGVLNPSLAVRCNDPFPDPMAGDAGPRRVNRTLLDRAVRALRRSGYNVAASAMFIRRSDLLPLKSVTVFAVSDENLFLKPGGFHYNFRHHVVPVRLGVRNLAQLTMVETLAPNVTVRVNHVDGAVSVDGVAVEETEVYRNAWIVVVSVMGSLDDVVLDSELKAPVSVLSPPQFPGVPASAPGIGSPSPAPFPAGVSPNLPSIGTPSQAPFPADSANAFAIETPTPAPLPGDFANGFAIRTPSPAPFPGDSANAPAIGTPFPGDSMNAYTIGTPSLAPFPGDSPDAFAIGNPSPAPFPANAFATVTPSPAPIPGDSANAFTMGTPYPAPGPSPGDSANAPTIGAPSPAAFPGDPVNVISIQAPSPATLPGDYANVFAIGTRPPTRDDDKETRCVAADGVEGGDLLCPPTRQLLGMGDDVDESNPSDANGQDSTHSHTVRLSQHVNIADDVFFYI